VRWTGTPHCDCGDQCPNCPCAVALAKCTVRCHPTVTAQRKCTRYKVNSGVHTWQSTWDREHATKFASAGEDCFSLADICIDVLPGNRDEQLDLLEDGRDEDRKLPLQLRTRGATTFTWRNAPKQFSFDEHGNFSHRQDVTFRLLCGDPSTAAIYVRVEQEDCPQLTEAIKWRHTLHELTEELEKNAFTRVEPETLVRHFTTMGPHERSADAANVVSPEMLTPSLSFFPGLMALVAVARVYEQLASATVSLEVLKRPLRPLDPEHQCPSSSIQPARISRISCLQYDSRTSLCMHSYV
jgi:hypothetical protein